MLGREVPLRREELRRVFIFAASLEKLVEHADQHQPCAMDASTDFSRGSLQEGGCLLRRQVSEVAEDESRSNAVIDVLERFAKHPREIAGLESSVGEVAPFPGERNQAARF